MDITFRHYITLLTALNLFLPTTFVSCYDVEHSGRYRREDSPPLSPENVTVYLTVRDEVEKYQVFKLDHSHMANDSLKVWTVHTRRKESDDSKMEPNSDLKRVGAWITYRNYYDKSAVLYFPKHKLMVGILGKKYHLDYVPYDGTEEFNVTIPYTSDYARKKRDIDSLEEWIDNFSISEKFKRSVDENRDRSKQYQFYLESLVFISGKNIKPLPSIVTNFIELKSEHYITHVLSYFNVVDMFFTRMKFKINIAGIVIRKDGSNFPFVEQGALDTTTRQLRLRKVNDALLKFISKRKTVFTRDSIDFVIHLTDHLIYNEEANKTVEHFLTYPKEGIMKAKQNKLKYAYPVIFVPSNLTISSVQRATDLIFHVIGGANFVKNVNSSIDETSVIIENFHNCTRCFRWNEDWCNFVNEPTSLGNTPRQLITKDQQCWCNDWRYYFDDSSNKTVTDICNNGFECQFNNQTIANVTMVMDGTPCDENKICWNNECVTKAA